MTPKRKVMPKGLQIYNFKRLFLEANADREDPTAEMDNIDWEAVLDEACTYHENLHNLENNYPEYNWSKPYEEMVEDMAEEYEDEGKWHEEPEFEICPRCGYTNPRIKRDVWHRSTNVKLHESKAGKYVYGRIQLTTPKEWIGCKVEIYVGVAKPELPRETSEKM